MLREPTDHELAAIIAVRHRAAEMRHRLEPGRDLAARLPLILSLPGATEQSGLYAHDISDQLQRVVSDLTALEERCVTVLGLHASLVGNRVAGVSRRLAAVATVFLPVSFLAGYFGQNFNVLTSKIETGWLAFLTLGVALYAVVVVAAVLWLRRRGWH